MSTKTRERALKACIPCRKSKRKCNREFPCSRCLQTKKTKYCSYSNEINISIKRSNIAHNKLINVATRRKYIEAFFSGINPVVLFARNSFSLILYDNPLSLSHKLQYNAILASSIRGFGAPKHIYESFEKKAIEISSQLITDFSYDSALGFNFLAFYYWGKDNLLASHYRNIAISLSKQALLKQENCYAKKDLTIVLLGSMPIHKVEVCNNIKNELLNLIPSNLRQLQPSNHLVYSNNILTLEHIEQFTIVHTNCEKLFAFTGNILPIPASPNELFQQRKELDDITEILLKYASSPMDLIIRSMNMSLNALSLHASGLIDDCITVLSSVVNLLYTKTYLIGMAGPQFIIVFHSIFLLAIQNNLSDIAYKIHKLQEKQALIYPMAIYYYEEDKQELLKYQQYLSLPNIISQNHYINNDNNNYEDPINIFQIQEDNYNSNNITEYKFISEIPPS